MQKRYLHFFIVSMFSIFLLTALTTVGGLGMAHAAGTTIRIISGHDGSPIRGAKVVVASKGMDKGFQADKDGIVRLDEKLSYNTDIFVKKKKMFRRRITIKRRRRQKIDLSNITVEMFKSLDEDGVFLVTGDGYEPVNYNPVEQEDGDGSTELYITGKPTMVSSGAPIRILENNMDEIQMIHKAESGLFAYDPPDSGDRLNSGSDAVENINEFVLLHKPKAEAGFYVVFPKIYSKYNMDDAFFFRIK